MATLAFSNLPFGVDPRLASVIRAHDGFIVVEQSVADKVMQAVEAADGRLGSAHVYWLHALLDMSGSANSELVALIKAIERDRVVFVTTP